MAEEVRMADSEKRGAQGRRPIVGCLVGDKYHDGDAMRETLGAVFDAIDVQPVFFPDPMRVPWDDLDQFAVLCVARCGSFHDGDPEWNTEKREQRIERFVHRGGGLLALHAGLANYEWDRPYVRTVRGRFLFHPAEHPEFSVSPRRSARSDGENVAAPFELAELTIRDEMYFVRVDVEHTTVLMDATHPQYGRTAAAWAHPHGQGKVVAYTPGHTDAVLKNAGFRRTVGSAVRWLCAR
ncbi:MAG: hypothetical protein EA382_03200 [Spirochaetaceae bacterium]|nr:MAG: hypothetical protein EA382_03200 [Spirochaetaceae bacterium]